MSIERTEALYEIQVARQTHLYTDTEFWSVQFWTKDWVQGERVGKFIYDFDHYKDEDYPELHALSLREQLDIIYQMLIDKHGGE